MKTIFVLARLFKNQFVFLDELKITKDGQAKLAWPSTVAPIRFFNEEGLYRVTCVEGKKLWVVKAEKARIRLNRISLSDEYTTAQLWAGVNAVLRGEIITNEIEIIIKNNETNLFRKIEELTKGLEIRIIRQT